MGLYDRDYYQDERRVIGTFNPQSMTTTLIIINVVIFVANFLLSRGPSQPINEFLALRPADLSSPINWYRFLTNGFAHGSAFHILFNMLGLHFLGVHVEKRYGRGEYLRLYLICIVFCSLIWALRQRVTLPQEMMMMVRLVGASGAVIAVTMLFVFNYLNVELRIWGVVPIKAWVIGIGVIVFNLLGNAGLLGNEKPVAYDVHLAGAAFAAIYFYTSLSFANFGNFWNAIRNKWKRRKFKVHQPEDELPALMQGEADRILDKIHREGQDSLTAKERKSLEEYSRAVRKKRSH